MDKQFMQLHLTSQIHMRTIYIHLLVHAAMPINQLKSYLVHIHVLRKSLQKQK